MFSDRSSLSYPLRVCIAIAAVLAVFVLGTGLSDLGHDHWADDGQHHCVACHFQQSTFLADSTDSAAPLFVLLTEARPVGSTVFVSTVLVLELPLRGPPHA